MEISKCMGCMEPFRGYPCPNCGFDPQKQRRLEYALPPETILAGKYLVGRPLGQGGFGMTYIGWDIALERKVAIKEYYPAGQVSRTPGTRALTWYTSDNALSARQEGMQVFLKEGRKMARLDQIPNVVKVMDLFQENETAYIVMDFVEGETLKARLQKSGPMTWEQARKIFQPAIRAMAAVHRQGIIHRDLSPDNLMLTKDGGVQILDLGAAKDLNVNSGASSMQVAKAGFSPWEQYTQRGNSGTWTDVYAMAATIYYTITGKLPPNAMDRVDKDSLEWGLPALQALPASALSTLKKAMAVTAGTRVQTMEELERGLFGSTPEPPGKSKTKVVIAVAAAVAICGGIAAGVILNRPAGKEVFLPTEAITKAPAETLAAVPTEAPAVPPTEVPAATSPQAPAGTGYATAQALLEDGKYMQAMQAFSALGDSAKAQEARERYLSSQQSPIAAGQGQTFGICSSGTVLAAGYENGSAGKVGDWTDIIALAAGNDHTVGLKSDGTVVAAGSNMKGRCDVAEWTNMVAIAAGDYHTVGLRRDGTVAATGWNADGRCDVGGWADIISIAAGGFHTVGLRQNGTVVAAGQKSSGQCDVGGWKDIVAVAAGEWHTVGLRSDGTVVAVGQNADGQCNVGSWTNVIAIAASTQTTVGLRRDGTIVATGINDNGQCDVDSWTDIAAIAAASNHTVGLRQDGTVVAVGQNKSGQCEVSGWKGIGVSASDSTPYAAAQALLKDGRYMQAMQAFTALGNTAKAQEAREKYIISQRATLEAGMSYAVGLQNDGTVASAGDNKEGQCNVGSWTDIIAVSAGYWHAVGLRSDGTVVAVGNNTAGQCEVDSWRDIVAIAAGHGHTIGLRSDGTVVAAGDNTSGQCEVGSWTDIVAISAGYGHTVGLRSDGTAVAVGYDEYGQRDVSGWTDLVAITAGMYRTVGLKSDGTVVAIGDNREKGCDVGSWKNIIAVTANGGHTVGLQQNGTVVATGWNEYNQCDISSWTDIVAVSEGIDFTVGLRRDGTVVAVGDNEHGQCDVENLKSIRLPQL